MNTSVTFPPNSRPNDQQPFYILILGDNFIEIDEVFAVNLSAVSPDIIVDPGSAVITINHDGDSKLPNFVYYIVGYASFKLLLSDIAISMLTIAVMMLT